MEDVTESVVGAGLSVICSSLEMTSGEVAGALMLVVSSELFVLWGIVGMFEGVVFLLTSMTVVRAEQEKMGELLQKNVCNKAIDQATNKERVDKM